MSQKIYLYIRKGSEDDIREALDDILSSGLVERIADEKGQTVSLEVRTADPEAAAGPQGKAASRTPVVLKKVLARKSAVRSGIECITAMTQAVRGEEDTCLGQLITLTDCGGGKEELEAQRLKTLWDMNQPRVFVMELPGQAVIEGSASSWYPLDGLESSSAT